MANKDTNKQNRILTIIFCAITLGIMAFIFVQSAMPDYVSDEESSYIVDIVKGIINSVGNSSINPELLTTIVRKLAHFTEYLVFGASLVLSIKGLTEIICARKNKETRSSSIDETKSKTLIMWPLLAWAFGTLYAISDEFHQYFVPGRSCELRDMCIDSAGVAVGCIICMIILKNLNKKKISSGIGKE